VPEIWICNASPIILLSKAGALHILTLFTKKVIIPKAVQKELKFKNDKNVAAFLKSRLVEVKSPSAIHPGVLEWGLGSGETEVISLYHLDFFIVH